MELRDQSIRDEMRVPHLPDPENWVIVLLLVAIVLLVLVHSAVGSTLTN